MLYMIIATVLALVAIVSATFWILVRKKGVSEWTATYRNVSLTALSLFALTTIIFSVQIVDARAVGINTAFGKYRGTLNSGFNWVAPWSGTEEFSTRLQDADLNDKDGSKGESVYVSFSAPRAVDASGNPIPGTVDVAGGGNGNLSAIIRWQISSDQTSLGAKALWEKFKTFDDVRDRLVKSESQQVVADVANDYTAGVASVNQSIIGDEVAKRLSSRLARYGIVVDSVAIKAIDLDASTRASLQKIVDNINKTTAAKEEQARAIIDNQTAKLRAESGALSREANVRYCLDVVNSWDVAKNGPLPATLNCNLGGDAAATPVIVSQGK